MTPPATPGRAAPDGARPTRPPPDGRRGSRAGCGLPRAKAGRAARRGWSADAQSEHLRTNLASLLAPPLPEAARTRLASLFGHLVGVGLDAPHLVRRARV